MKQYKLLLYLVVAALGAGLGIYRVTEETTGLNREKLLSSVAKLVGVNTHSRHDINLIATWLLNGANYQTGSELFSSLYRKSPLDTTRYFYELISSHQTQNKALEFLLYVRNASPGVLVNGAFSELLLQSNGQMYTKADITGKAMIKSIIMGLENLDVTRYNDVCLALGVTDPSFFLLAFTEQPTEVAKLLSNNFNDSKFIGSLSKSRLNSQLSRIPSSAALVILTEMPQANRSRWLDSKLLESVAFAPNLYLEVANGPLGATCEYADLLLNAPDLDTFQHIKDKSPSVVTGDIVANWALTQFSKKRISEVQLAEQLNTISNWSESTIKTTVSGGLEAFGDPELVYSKLISSLPEIGQSPLLVEMVKQLSSVDLVVATNFLNIIPRGRSRDMAIMGFVIEARSDTASTLIWAKSIDDQIIREKTLEEINLIKN